MKHLEGDIYFDDTGDHSFELYWDNDIVRLTYGNVWEILPIMQDWLHRVQNTPQRES